MEFYSFGVGCVLRFADFLLKLSLFLAFCFVWHTVGLTRSGQTPSSSFVFYYKLFVCLCLLLCCLSSSGDATIGVDDFLFCGSAQSRFVVAWQRRQNVGLLRCASVLSSIV
jgi:hypothetical protein